MFDFLVARGLTNEALRWADYNRARTLAEGLGLLSKKGSGESASSGCTSESPSGKTGRLLFYSLEEKQSYLWAVTAQKTVLFSLPSKTVIDAAVQRYRESMSGQQVVFRPATEDGIELYRTLVEPAQALLPKRWKGGHHSRWEPEQPEFRDTPGRRPETALLDRGRDDHERQFITLTGTYAKWRADGATQTTSDWKQRRTQPEIPGITEGCDAGGECCSTFSNVPAESC